MIDENTWIISDTHFDHRNLVEKYEPVRLETYLKYGYKSFDDFQVDQWNSKIKDDDTVLHLGDFTIDKHDDEKTVYNILRFTEVLKGKKILLKGNHELEYDEVYEELGWVVVKEPSIGSRFPYIIKELCGKKILFCHIPIRMTGIIDKYSMYYNEINKVFIDNSCDICIHGHSHSKISKDTRCVNVSVENTAFLPTRIMDIIAKVNSK